MPEDEHYIVRGARMNCQCGSHHRKINLPISHGSYVNQKPMMNQNDYTVENVPHFGICSSPDNPSTETIYLIAENGQTISGKPCKPQLIEPWMNTKENTKVEGQPALITSSYQRCLYLGYIQFSSTGQQEE